jgi:hypothetical protein
MSVVAVTPNDIVHLSRERHTRKHDGRHIAWFVSDKYGQALLISQKLGPVRDWINARASAPHERVSVSSLYETATISKDSQRTGGFTKGRWAVTAVNIEDVADKLGRIRPQYDEAYVLAEHGCVTIR